MVLSWLLGAVFLHAAYLNIAGPSFIREEFQRWGYPSWFRTLVGALELLGAPLTAFGVTRPYGLTILAVVLAGVCWTLAKSAEWHRLSFPIVLLVIVALLFSMQSLPFTAP